MHSIGHKSSHLPSFKIHPKTEFKLFHNLHLRIGKEFLRSMYSFSSHAIVFLFLIEKNSS